MYVFIHQSLTPSWHEFDLNEEFCTTVSCLLRCLVLKVGRCVIWQSPILPSLFLWFLMLSSSLCMCCMCCMCCMLPWMWELEVVPGRDNTERERETDRQTEGEMIYLKHVTIKEFAGERQRCLGGEEHPWLGP